jgi:hypothetical protein
VKSLVFQPGKLLSLTDPAERSASSSRPIERRWVPFQAPSSSRFCSRDARMRLGSRPRSSEGRPQIDADFRTLIRRMSIYNLLWGAPAFWRVDRAWLCGGLSRPSGTWSRLVTRPVGAGAPSCVTMRRTPWICSWSRPSALTLRSNVMESPSRSRGGQGAGASIFGTGTQLKYARYEPIPVVVGFRYCLGCGRKAHAWRADDAALLHRCLQII